MTTVVPSGDNQTYLAAMLDAHIRPMDISTGKMLNDSKSHASDASYWISVRFRHGEASMVRGCRGLGPWCQLEWFPTSA